MFRPALACTAVAGPGTDAFRRGPGWQPPAGPHQRRLEAAHNKIGPSAGRPPHPGAADDQEHPHAGTPHGASKLYRQAWPRGAASPVAILMTWIVAILVAGPSRLAYLASATPVPAEAPPRYPLSHSPSDLAPCVDVTHPCGEVTHKHTHRRCASPKLRTLHLCVIVVRLLDPSRVEPDPKGCMWLVA
jgi:hypothetical protein